MEMKRLTKKHKPTNYTRYTEKTICLKNYNIRSANLNKAIDKLGELEDLMEKYNIDSVDELDVLLGCAIKNEEKIIELSADLGLYQNENTKLTEDIEKYWELQEELGCSLEVVFKALKKGVKVNMEFLDIDITDDILRPRLYYSDDFQCYGLSIQSWGYFVKLKDYQKTWWIKGEKNEKEN